MLISLAAAIVSLAGLCGLALRGFRLGDRPEDARVTAMLRTAWQADATRPVVAVTIRNPSATPMLTGMSVRAETPFRSRLLPPFRSRLLRSRPRFLPPRPVSMDVSVPRWTARRRFRAAQYDTVGLVPADADVRFTVLVPEEARCYVLTVVAGQGGRRLRVHRIALAQSQSRARAERLVPSAGTQRPAPPAPPAPPASGPRASGGHGA